MSAFIVCDTHINAIVTYAVERRVRVWNPAIGMKIDITSVNAEEIGRVLMDENVRSVCYRYDDNLDNDEKNAAASYRFKSYMRPLKAVQVIKACHCLSYQSCETDDWESTLAWRIVKAVENAAMHDLPGYETAAWEITVDTKSRAA